MLGTSTMLQLLMQGHYNAYLWQSGFFSAAPTAQMAQYWKFMFEICLKTRLSTDLWMEPANDWQEYSNVIFRYLEHKSPS